MESSWRRCSVHWGSKEEYDLDMGKGEWANTSCLNTSFILVLAQSMYHFHGTWTRNHRTLEVGCGLETEEEPHPSLDSVLGNDWARILLPNPSTHPKWYNRSTQQPTQQPLHSTVPMSAQRPFGMSPPEQEPALKRMNSVWLLFKGKF